MDEPSQPQEAFDQMLSRWDREAGHSDATLAAADEWARRRVAEINAAHQARLDDRPADGTGGHLPPSRRLEIRAPLDLSLAVAETRFRCGLTQAEMATEVALDRSAVARIESGAALPVAWERVLRLLRRHGATVHVILPPLPPEPEGAGEGEADSRAGAYANPDEVSALAGMRVLMDEVTATQSPGGAWEEGGPPSGPGPSKR